MWKGFLFEVKHFFSAHRMYSCTRKMNLRNFFQFVFVLMGDNHRFKMSFTEMLREKVIFLNWAKPNSGPDAFSYVCNFLISPEAQKQVLLNRSHKDLLLYAIFNWLLEIWDTNHSPTRCTSTSVSYSSLSFCVCIQLRRFIKQRNGVEC